MLQIILCLIFFSPLYSSAYVFECRFNDSRKISRDSVLYKVEDGHYIRLRDVSIKIKTDSVPNEENTDIVNYVNFKGLITNNKESRYIDTSVNSLKGYRYRQHGNKCIVTFQESTSDSHDITNEEESAILALAESCIRSEFCGTDIRKLDRDGNLFFQSTQSVLNEVVDFYTPKVIDLFLADDKKYKIQRINETLDDFYFSAQSGELEGLETIQRTKDMMIEHEKSKYTLELGFRFEELKISLFNTAMGWKFLSTFGDCTVNVKGASVEAKIAIEKEQNTCHLSLVKAELKSIQEIIVNVPIFDMFHVTYSIDSKDLSIIDIVMMMYINIAIPKIELDCQKYVDMLDQVF